MNIVESIAKYTKNPYALFDRYTNGNLFRGMSDEKYLKYKFRGRLGYPLDLKNPGTYNSIIQWLKINYRNKNLTIMVDKYEAKKYVGELIGEEHIIPTLGVWDNFDEIDFDKLPNQFVLKCTHDSGGLVICKDKSKLDVHAAREKITECLKKNFYYYGREWAYKNVKPRIIAEEYLEDDPSGNNNSGLTDYKFMCINGKCENAMICTERNSGHVKFFFFDKNWRFLKYQKVDANVSADFTMKRPEHFDEMWLLAEKIGADLPFARVDLYEAKGKVWFGEITLYPDSGFDTDITYETDVLLGEKMKVILR